MVSVVLKGIARDKKSHTLYEDYVLCSFSGLLSPSIGPDDEVQSEQWHQELLKVDPIQRNIV